MIELSPQAKKVINFLIPFVIAIAMLFGYNVTVVQPQIAEIQAQARGLFGPAEFQDVHVTGDQINEKTLAVTGNAAYAGNLSVVGTISAGALVSDAKASLISVATSGNITATGNITAGSFSTTGDASARNISATGTISSGGAANFGSLQISSVAFSGPVKYGTVASQANGASIAHGFATTPTVCIVGGAGGLTATIGTITTTQFTVNVPSTHAVYWLCGP